MAGKRKGVSDGSSSRKRNGDGDGDNRRLITPRDLELDPDSSSSDVFNNAKIKVKSTTGKTIRVKVKGSDTIGSIKVKIQAEELIPFDQQELIFRGVALKDMDTIANLRIKKKATFTLYPKFKGFITIHVQTELEKITLKLKPSDTISNIRSKMPRGSLDSGLLIFNDVVLDGNGTLMDFNIIDGSTLVFVYKVFEQETEVLVNTFTGKTITLLVDPSYTIDHLKYNLVEDTDIPLSEQVLIYNNMVLDDDGTLFDLNITSKSTLTLMRRPKEFEGFMEVFIKTLTGETVTLEVKPYDTIGDIKSMIPNKLNIPCDEQELIFNDMVIDDVYALAVFHIINGSTLTLMHRPTEFKGFMEIFIKTLTGETVTLKVKPYDTIGDIKPKIQNKLDLPCDEQELIFNDMVIDDVHALADFHIINGSTLTLMRVSYGFMRIFIKSYESRYFSESVTLNVRPSDTIRDVKSKLYDKKRIISPSMHRLVFNGKRLEDSATLAHYHITEESTVYFDDKLRFGNDEYDN